MMEKSARKNQPKTDKQQTEKQKYAEEFVHDLSKNALALSTQSVSQADIRTKMNNYCSYNTWCAGQNLHSVPGKNVLFKELKKQNVSFGYYHGIPDGILQRRGIFS